MSVHQRYLDQLQQQTAFQQRQDLYSQKHAATTTTTKLRNDFNASQQRDFERQRISIQQQTPYVAPAASSFLDTLEFGYYVSWCSTLWGALLVSCQEKNAVAIGATCLTVSSFVNLAIQKIIISLKERANASGQENTRPSITQWAATGKANKVTGLLFTAVTTCLTLMNKQTKATLAITVLFGHASASYLLGTYCEHRYHAVREPAFDPLSESCSRSADLLSLHPSLSPFELNLISRSDHVSPQQECLATLLQAKDQVSLWAQEALTTPQTTLSVPPLCLMIEDPQKHLSSVLRTLPKDPAKLKHIYQFLITLPSQEFLLTTLHNLLLKQLYRTARHHLQPPKPNGWLAEYGLKPKDHTTLPGDSLFDNIAASLSHSSPQQLRTATVQFMAAHYQTTPGYLQRMNTPQVQATELEISALALMLHRPILLLFPSQPPKIYNPDSPGIPLFLFHTHHFISCIPLPGLTPHQIFHWIKSHPPS